MGLALTLLTVLAPALVLGAAWALGRWRPGEWRWLVMALGVAPLGGVAAVYGVRADRLVPLSSRTVGTVPVARVVHDEGWTEDYLGSRPVYRREQRSRYDSVLKRTVFETVEVVDRYESYREERHLALAAAPLLHRACGAR